MPLIYKQPCNYRRLYLKIEAFPGISHGTFLSQSGTSLTLRRKKKEVIEGLAAKKVYFVFYNVQVFSFAVKDKGYDMCKNNKISEMTKAFKMLEVSTQSGAFPVCL